MELLVSKGAEPTAETSSGKNALIIAAEYGNFEF